VGVYGGPKVSSDGLVFSLDGANLKSFKGEATTNEIVVVTWAGDGSNQASFVKESVLITDENLKYKGYETYLWSPGTSNNCYLNGADLSTLRTSTVWTFSCYVKRQDGEPITSLSVYMYYPTSDGSAAGTIQDVGNGWYRISRTRTGTDNYLSLIGFTGFVTGHKYYLSGAQLEKKSYPTTFVATNTTRGTTVATGGGWADLSGRGNNGTLVNGVGENSANGGSLVFDGVDDRVDVINPGISQTFSVLSWINCTNVSSSNNIVSKNGPYFMRIVSSKLRFNVLTDTGWLFQVGNATLSNNVWYHLAMVYDGSTWKGYINSNLDFSVSKTGTISSNAALYIGYTPAGGEQAGFNGNIAQVSIYNRALTASEIQQNYNATKSRFGL
jgi:hypothetical protein